MNQKTGIAGGNHAFLVGQVVGLLRLAQNRPDLRITNVEGLSEDGEYTNEIRVTKPSGTYIIAIYPENARED